MGTPLAQVLGGERDRVWSRAALLDQVRDLPPRSAPGTRYGYSNTDYLLVALIIERVTHHSLAQELRRHIVRPLHLRDTRFPVAGGRLLSARMRRAMLDGVATGRPGRRSGLGVELERTPHGLRVGHAGDVLGFSVELFSDARGGCTAIAATNLKLAPPAVGDALDAAEAAATRAACGRPGVEPLGRTAERSLPRLS